MSYFPSFRKEDPETAKLPTVEEPKISEDAAKSIEEKRKDSATMPSTSKPIPARTLSGIHEPTDKPSQTKRAPSDVHRTQSGTPKKTNGATQKRPALQRRRTTAHTEYIDMLLELDTMPKLHNILAGFFTWILLAGYIVFPATFNKWQKEQAQASKDESALKAHALSTVSNVPLLYVAAFACGIGVLGCLWLWWKHTRNYIWIINRIFLPALMNSIAGLISTIVNIYSAQDGQYSVTAKATMIVTGACSVVSIALFLLYNFIMLGMVKRRHDKETKAWEQIQTAEAENQEGKDAGRFV